MGEDNGINAVSQYPVPVYYKKQIIGDYAADILVENEIILELKVAKEIEPIFEAQLLHYLKATKLKLGYILNFGAPDKIQFKRLVN